MHKLEGVVGKPSNQDIQSYVLFGDLETRRSDILRILTSGRWLNNFFFEWCKKLTTHQDFKGSKNFLLVFLFLCFFSDSNQGGDLIHESQILCIHWLCHYIFSQCWATHVFELDFRNRKKFIEAVFLEFFSGIQQASIFELWACPGNRSLSSSLVWAFLVFLSPLSMNWCPRSFRLGAKSLSVSPFMLYSLFSSEPGSVIRGIH